MDFSLFSISVVSIATFFPLILLSLFRPPLLPTYLGSKPLSHMSILLGAELQIPIDVGELRFQPFQLSQSTLDCMFFPCWQRRGETSEKLIVLYTPYAHCLFCMSGTETRL